MAGEGEGDSRNEIEGVGLSLSDLEDVCVLLGKTLNEGGALSLLEDDSVSVEVGEGLSREDSDGDIEEDSEGLSDSVIVELSLLDEEGTEGFVSLDESEGVAEELAEPE